MTDKAALKGLRVLDLSRVLAGPACTQILGDLGADIIKIERPGSGDDTRHWGPPFLKDEQGQDTRESAYYLSANRNKRSVSIDISKPEGQVLIDRLLGQCDILVENFKTGGLGKYGLDFATVHARHPHLIYCSVTGFGQTGPRAEEPGYDFLAQAMSGLMAITGAPDGEPQKAGVAVSDVITGLYAAIGILAALENRRRTGKGQHVDVSLLDCTLASLVNVAQYYLTSGTLAARQGNAHATIVPYQAFATTDGHVILAIGNDAQFRRFAQCLATGWADDPRFATNQARIHHRATLVPEIAALIAQKSTSYWTRLLQEHDIPVGPVNTVAQAFAMDQVRARAMTVTLPHAASPTPVTLVGSPLKLSDTPVSYDRAPPTLGQHTDEVLTALLGLSAEDIEDLRLKQII